MNLCRNCGIERHPIAKPGNCQECHSKLLRDRHKQEWRNKLQLLGYDVLEFEINDGAHSKIKVLNRVCNHSFIAKLNNILCRRTICGECGPTKRIKPAFNAWYEKNKRTYDIQKWNDYLDITRGLSNQAYEANKHLLNPLDLPRKKAGSHPNAVNLDHIIPIIYGFKHGLPPEILADIRNLRIVDAKSNLKKKQKLTLEAKQLLQELNKL